jgi:hypothetical protein
MQWEVRMGEEVSVPYEEDDVVAMLSGGALDAATLVRPVGKQAWKPVGRHAPFAAALRRAALRAELQGPAAPAGPPPSPALPLPPPKDPARWDQQTRLDLVAQPQSAWPQVAPSAPRAGRVAPPPPPPPPVRAGFVEGLFDLSFTTLITTRVLKVLYLFFLIGLGAMFLVGIGGGIVSIVSASEAQSGLRLAASFGQMVMTVVGCSLFLIWGRILFEGIVVFFRIAEHLAEIDRKTRGGG